MFSAVLRKVDAFSQNFDEHSRHLGFLNNSLAVKLRKVSEKRENTRKFSGCGFRRSRFDSNYDPDATLMVSSSRLANH